MDRLENGIILLETGVFGSMLTVAAPVFEGANDAPVAQLDRASAF